MDPSVEQDLSKSPSKQISNELKRGDSISEVSQTASDYIDSQLQLEADAREALPYAFDRCTHLLGPLRQNVFACLTCNPPPASPSEPYVAAGVCYSCSIACHGEHTLVELFHRRDFSCDCGTTRLPPTSPCTLRVDPTTGLKGPVHSQVAADRNTYNQNFQNRFCGCGEIYNAHEEKGTMFQCLGLSTENDGGCGEDWWHPECILGLQRGLKEVAKPNVELGTETNGSSEMSIGNGMDDEQAMPSGFPEEDEFDTFICYKCVNANPWIKRYAGCRGFLEPVYKTKLNVSSNSSRENKQVAKEQDTSAGQFNEDHLPKTSEQKSDLQGFANLDIITQRLPNEFCSHSESQIPRLNGRSPADTSSPSINAEVKILQDNSPATAHVKPPVTEESASKKRKLESQRITSPISSPIAKRSRISISPPPPYHSTLPPPPKDEFSLFLCEGFRDHFCKCDTCYPDLQKHPQLLEEEHSYEPPLSSEDGGEGAGAESRGTGSLLERGEAALSNIDRVRAIEGVMVYNHLKDKVKSFLQPFAESGQPVRAEDIKAYFEKLRGDDLAIKAAAAGGALRDDDEGGEGPYRKEQSGY